MRIIKKKTVAAFLLTLAGMTAGIGSLAFSTANAETKKMISETNEVTKNNTVEIEIEGKKTEVPASGNIWIKSGGFYHFVQNGKLVKGWKRMTSNEGEKTPHWSYFDPKNGRIYTDWHKMGKAEGEKTEHWSYFGPNGWLRTGWQQMGKGTGNPDGNAARHWSYFGDNGWLRTGWQQMGKGTGNPDGNAARHWSFFGGNGWLVTGWKTLTKADGESVEHKSYFGNNGWLTTGLKKINGTLYSFDPRGWMLSDDSEMLNKAQSYSSSTKYLILVNRNKCRTAIFEGKKNNWNYTRYWSCAVGKPSTPTVTGVFRTGQKGLYFNTGTYERCWYFTRFYGSYLFHSVLYDRSSTPSVITDGTLGAKVSHGCVRLNINDAKWIYDVIPSNTTVVVYN